MDKPETDIEAKEALPEEPEEKRAPRYLLVIATLMIGVSVAAYTFEDELYDIYFSSDLFVAGLTLPVVVALGCLYLYSNALLKSSRRQVIRRSKSTGGVTYNVYGSGPTVGDVKASHAQRKSARHLRKQLARDTPPPNPAPSDDEDNG